MRILSCGVFPHCFSIGIVVLQGLLNACYLCVRPPIPTGPRPAGPAIYKLYDIHARVRTYICINKYVYYTGGHETPDNSFFIRMCVVYGTCPSLFSNPSEKSTRRPSLFSNPSEKNTHRPSFVHPRLKKIPTPPLRGGGGRAQRETKIKFKFGGCSRGCFGKRPAYYQT